MRDRATCLWFLMSPERSCITRERLFLCERLRHSLVWGNLAEPNSDKAILTVDLFDHPGTSLSLRLEGQRLGCLISSMTLEKASVQRW